MKKIMLLCGLLWAMGAHAQNANWSEQGDTAFRLTGNVIVGTTDSKNATLLVDGGLHSKKIELDLTNWPDYVFEAGHDLPALEEVAQHLKEKGHLINFPSAQEVETNGLELGEINRLLLEKVEELTLYILQLQQEYQENQRQLRLLLEQNETGERLD